MYLGEVAQHAVSVSGQGGDKFNVTFESLDGGRALRVTRRLNNEQLTQPVIIRSVYEKISDAARWDIYGEPASATMPDQSADNTVAPVTPPTTPSAIPSATPDARADAMPVANSARGERDDAAVLRDALAAWIAATNARDIQKQMTFYLPTLSAFYLTRNVSRAAVRAEKVRVFERADIIDVRAEAPELIFQDDGQTAIMRFRKHYRIEGGGLPRSGAVVQELRWQQTAQGWKIFSERDVRIVR